MPTDEIVRALIAAEVRERLHKRGTRPVDYGEVDGAVDTILAQRLDVVVTRRDIHVAALAVVEAW